jgi:hypothetical protein
MSRDPHAYRIYAIECDELASSVRTPELKVMFSERSRGWQTLALAIEEAEDRGDDWVNCTRTSRTLPKYS